jgi:hypothetical protein
MNQTFDFPHEYHHGNYREIYCLRQVSELCVIRDILALLTAFSVDAVTIDAGGARARGRLVAAANARGLAIGDLHKIATPDIPKGWADIEATLAPHGRALFIEVKHPRWVDECGRMTRAEGLPTKEQLEFLRSKKLRGALVMVAWASEDVEHYLLPELQRNRKALLNAGRTSNGVQPDASFSKLGK